MKVPRARMAGHVRSKVEYIDVDVNPGSMGTSVKMPPVCPKYLIDFNFNMTKDRMRNYRFIFKFAILSGCTNIIAFNR